MPSEFGVGSLFLHPFDKSDFEGIDFPPWGLELLLKQVKKGMNMMDDMSIDAGDVDCIELFDRNDDICGSECVELEVDVYKSVVMIWQLHILEMCKWQHVLHW